MMSYLRVLDLSPSRKNDDVDFPSVHAVGAAYAYDLNFYLCHVNCYYYCGDDDGFDAINYCFFRYCCLWYSCYAVDCCYDDDYLDYSINYLVDLYFAARSPLTRLIDILSSRFLLLRNHLVCRYHLVGIEAFQNYHDHGSRHVVGYIRLVGTEIGGFKVEKKIC